MKQVFQNIKTGQTEIADVAAPSARSGYMRVQTTASLISPGTEKMLLDFGKAGWIEKARQQPDKVKMVLEKAKVDGLTSTIDAVLKKLDKPLPLGYCNVGVVVDSGDNTVGFEPGDRVVSNGHHAEVVSVPVNLTAKIPPSVSDDEAAFTVLGAIALQSIRLAAPTIGECFVVTGLGIVGLLTVQLLRANGCRVLGVDFNKDRLEMARKYGAETVDLGEGQDPIAVANAFSRNRGVDGVIIATATNSDEPMHQAAVMCRKRGRVVLVGVAGLNLARDDFFKKEITFQVSASYGPGRYDKAYEEDGHDYPLGFVRWTEQRNFEAVLDMMSEGRLDVGSLISHRFDIAEADQAYSLLGRSKDTLGIMLQYPGHHVTGSSQTVDLRAQAPIVPAQQSAASDRPVVGFVGAGNYATSTLIPAFRAARVELHCLSSNTGTNGTYAGKKFGFRKSTTDTANMFADSAVNTVVIATQHDSHAGLVQQALESGKHVFVEKPLCLTSSELDAIKQTYDASDVNGQAPILMVGFNRRFAPQVVTMKRMLATKAGAKSIVMTVNAGAIESSHWTQDTKRGGGRIIGEACHFVDLLRFLIGHKIDDWSIAPMTSQSDDTATIVLKFADGSIGSINYFANGSRSFPKERLEVFASGAVLQLDNFRKLTGFGWPKFKRQNLWRQDKGQNACVEAFADAVARNNPSPIPIDEIFEVSELVIDLGQSSGLGK